MSTIRFRKIGRNIIKEKKKDEGLTPFIYLKKLQMKDTQQPFYMVEECGSSGFWGSVPYTQVYFIRLSKALNTLIKCDSYVKN